MKEDVKEVEEAIKAILEVGVFILTTFKDGVQVDDFQAVMAKIKEDPEFMNILKEGYEGYDKVPAGMKSLGLLDFASIAKMVISYVPEYLAAFKK